MWENIIGTDKFDFMERNLSEKGLEAIIFNNKITGLGATILNGYSYKRLLGNLTVYTDNEDLDGMDCLTYKFIYLPDNDTNVGYEESTVASPVRNICDYLIYPDRLMADVYLLDALEGFVDEGGNLDDVYLMMEKLGIPRSSLDDWLQYMYKGSNMCQTEDLY